jgi:hypothetical protein
MKNPDPLMGAKLKCKIHLQNTFFRFFQPFCVFGFKVLKKSKKVSKNAEFHDHFKSAFKKCIRKKVISKQD